MNEADLMLLFLDIRTGAENIDDDTIDITVDWKDMYISIDGEDMGLPKRIVFL